MVGARFFRRQQHEDQIDRLAVHRFIVDGPFQAGEDAADGAGLAHAAMGNGDAGADAGGAQPLALHQGLEDAPFGQPVQLVRLGGEFLEQLFLALDLQRGKNRVGSKQVGNVHHAS
jgi:hypothetical protein